MILEKKNKKNLLYIIFFITFFGFLNIFSTEFDQKNFSFDFLLKSFTLKQILRFIVAIISCFLIYIFDINFFLSKIKILYFFNIILLFATKIFSRSIYGHNSWLSFGFFSLQPLEFSKTTTALMLSLFLSKKLKYDNSLKIKIQILFIILIPILLIIWQGDLGSCIVFFSFGIVFLNENFFVKEILFLIYITLFAILGLFFKFQYLLIFVFYVSFFFAFYLKKLKKILQLTIFNFIGLFISYLSNFIIFKVLKPHQQNRILSWIGENDCLGIDWNLAQSKIAIGSGGFWGKGIFQGTQIRYGFVPERHTDFIFCTVGEEYGFLGSFILISTFSFLLYEIIKISESQNNKFKKIYGYSIFSILFTHIFLNIGMTIGIFPIVGIPLPFMSYGGSSLINFIIMIFIFYKI